MPGIKKFKFQADDLVRHKPAATPHGLSDLGVGIVVGVSSVGNVYVMFPIWEKPRAMHPSNLRIIS